MPQVLDRLAVVNVRWDDLDYVPVSVAANALLDEQLVEIAVTVKDSDEDDVWFTAEWVGEPSSVREAWIKVGPDGGVMQLEIDQPYVVSVRIHDTSVTKTLNAYELWPTRYGPTSAESFATPSVNVTLPLAQSQIEGLVAALQALTAADIAEVAARIAGDLTLEGEIDAVEGDISALEAADLILNGAIAAEVTRALNAEALKANKSSLRINIADRGAVPVSVNPLFDNRTAILDAIATAAVFGGSVLIPAGVWGFTGEIQVPSNVNLVGEGKKATTLLCKSADACIHFGPASGGGARHGSQGWFGVDANDLATQPVLWGLGANASYFDILVQDSPGAGYKFVSAQNLWIFGIEVQNCLIGVWVDGGAKNLTFVCGTVNECDTGWKLASEIQHFSGDDVHHGNPQAIAVYAVLTEAESKPAAIGLLINSGKDTTWRDGAFNCGGSCVKVILNDPRGASPAIRLLLIDGTKMSGAGTGNGIWVANCPFEVTCIGEATFEGCVTQFRLDNVAARVHLNLFQPLAPAVTSRFATTTGYTYEQMVSHGGKFKIKTATDVAVTSTTYVTPAAMLMRGLGPGATWDFEGRLIVDADTGAGFQIDLDVPSDAVVQWGCSFFNAQSTPTAGAWTELYDLNLLSSPVRIYTPVAGGAVGIRIWGTITTPTSGDAGFKVRKGLASGVDAHLRHSSWLDWVRRDP